MMSVHPSTECRSAPRGCSFNFTCRKEASHSIPYLFSLRAIPQTMSQPKGKLLMHNNLSCHISQGCKRIYKCIAALKCTKICSSKKKWFDKECYEARKWLMIFDVVKDNFFYQKHLHEYKRLIQRKRRLWEVTQQFL